MRSIRSFCSLLPMAAIILLSCSSGRMTEPEKKVPTRPAWEDSRGVDPLELPQDREIIPALKPRTGSIAGRDILIDSDSVAADSLPVALLDSSPRVDTLSSQAFRVQLFTSKLFGDARHQVKLAEEVFDQLVYLDYEVPYFKVRVGSFASRDGAEEYRQRAKASGYGEAWVVLVNVNVKEPALLYEGMELPLDQSDSTYGEPGERPGPKPQAEE